METSKCEICGGTFPIRFINNNVCHHCSTQSGDYANPSSSTESTKPSIIATLSTLGWLLFAMTGLSGVFLISQNGGGIFGASLIIAGVFQLSIFLGFSAIIDQLYQINQNTSQSDKDD